MCRGLPAISRSAAGVVVSPCSGLPKSTICAFMGASIARKRRRAARPRDRAALTRHQVRLSCWRAKRPTRSGSRRSARRPGRRLRFVAGEALTHGLDDHALLRNAGFFEFARHHLRAFLRQAQVERVITARVREARDTHAHVLEIGNQRAELGDARAIIVANRGLRRCGTAPWNPPRRPWLRCAPSANSGFRLRSRAAPPRPCAPPAPHSSCGCARP